jgi:hypothetical protein
MDQTTQRLMSGAAGAGGDKVYVDDVFSTFFYKGQSTPSTVTTGIDMTEGGMVWVKNRSTGNPAIGTKELGSGYLTPNGTGALDAFGNGFNTFTSTGFTTTQGNQQPTNENGNNYASFSWKKSPGFFDVVTYTGNGSNQTISHSLDATVGCIIIKNTDSSSDWYVWHRKVANQYAGYLSLNTSASEGNSSTIWNQVRPTTSAFSVGNFDGTNKNNEIFVAYIFAEGTSDSEVFGPAGDKSIIKCGQYSGNGSTGANANNVDVGFEPQWLLIKNRTQSATQWMLLNKTSGIPGSNLYSPYLKANSADAEKMDDIRLQVTSTGFSPTDSEDTFNKSGETYIYIAIRSPDGLVGKPPDAGTDVLAMAYSNGSSFPNFVSNFTVDYWLARSPTDVDPFTTHGRLTSDKYMRTSTTGAESSSSLVKHDSSIGVGVSFGSSYLAWMWKRHAGFDVVTYKGVSNTQHLNHSLGKAPEMIWIKNRTKTTWFGNSQDWLVYHKGVNGGTNPEQYILKLNTNDAQADESNFADTAPTATQFSVGSDTRSSYAGANYIALLFASVEGISKVGSFTGNGTSASSTQTITTGFQPRFVIIKRTDFSNSYTGWTVLDTTRGWGSGNDQALFLNSSAAQSAAQYGEPTSTGFILAGDHYATNTNNGTYIYYAHA